MRSSHSAGFVAVGKGPLDQLAAFLQQALAVPALHTWRVGTDPRYAMETRKGTGYYKVPSLKGVWYRGPFGHHGSAATLEDWFDPARLRDDYTPTGYRGYNGQGRGLKGHSFGLKISAGERRALIAFLRTL